MTDPAVIESRLRAVEPGWRFVKARVLTQAHRWLRDRDHRVPPDLRLPLVLSRSDAEASGCFPPPVLADAPPALVFVTSPTDGGIGDRSEGRQLLHFWAMLFRLCLPTADAEKVWETLPPVLRREAEAVLTESGSVPSDATATELARAFALDLLTRARFAPAELEYRYPGLPEWTDWRTRFGEGFDEAAIFEATRPVGAEEPELYPPPALPPISKSEPSTATDAERAGRAGRQAVAAEASGNHARAAILFTGAARACSRGSTKYRSDAKNALRVGLVERLAPILRWDGERRDRWRRALPALLEPAAKKHWSAAAKALYDLQKIAVDLEGDSYAVDPWGWLLSGGRRPVLRKLALSRLAWLHQRLLRVEKHLSITRMPAGERHALEALLRDEIRAADAALRAAMEPILFGVFQKVGFVPGHIVEAIALRKIADELLDAAIAKGFFRFGDLRDTLARNRLKMPDLAGPVTLFRGDALLRADAGLGEALDGVYYPGEIYLRWFHRGSAIAFGTRIGRWVTLHLALPFGAAYMTVEFAKYMVHEVASIGRFFAGLFSSAADPPQPVAHEHHASSMPPETIAVVVGLGFLYLGLIHSPTLRKFASHGLNHVGRAVRWIFVSLPGRIWDSGPMRALRRNPAVRWFHRRLAAPALGAGSAALVGWANEIPAYDNWEIVLGTFASLAVILNTPWGRRVQESAEDGLAWIWRQIRTNFFPGLFGWIAWIFRHLLAALDRLIYSIDEWFHFRPEQAKPSLVLKIALAAVWFPVRYVLRFAIYLLIEPQINPIKHFPVVTVSHKLLLPMIPNIAATTGIAKKWVTGAVSGVPGIFGFLAWELRENWRLYAANRPERLEPLALGHHGESVRGLLRPGLHSGTIPSAFGAIRRAFGKAEGRRSKAKIHKPVANLHHVEVAMRHFAERELFSHLRSARAWADSPLRCDGVHLGLQHIDIAVRGDGAPAEIRFELIDAAIAGHCEDAAFLEGRTPEQIECWRRAVLGFWAMGAVPCDDPRLDWEEWVSFWEARKG